MVQIEHIGYRRLSKDLRACTSTVQGCPGPVPHPCTGLAVDTVCEPWISYRQKRYLTQRGYPTPHGKDSRLTGHIFLPCGREI
jgi:hypothetical protein